jgi:hypothetical protein
MELIVAIIILVNDVADFREAGCEKRIQNQTGMDQFDDAADCYHLLNRSHTREAWVGSVGGDSSRKLMKIIPLWR